MHSACGGLDVRGLSWNDVYQPAIAIQVATYGCRCAVATRIDRRCRHRCCKDAGAPAAGRLFVGPCSVARLCVR